MAAGGHRDPLIHSAYLRLLQGRGGNPGPSPHLPVGGRVEAPPLTQGPDQCPPTFGFWRLGHAPHLHVGAGGVEPVWFFAESVSPSAPRTVRWADKTLPSAGSLWPPNEREAGVGPPPVAAAEGRRLGMRCWEPFPCLSPLLSLSSASFPLSSLPASLSPSPLLCSPPSPMYHYQLQEHHQAMSH